MTPRPCAAHVFSICTSCVLPRAGRPAPPLLMWCFPPGKIKALPGRWNMLPELKWTALEPKARVYWCFHSLKKQSFRRLVSDWGLLCQHKIQWDLPKQMIYAPPSPREDHIKTFTLCLPNKLWGWRSKYLWGEAFIHPKEMLNNRMLGCSAIIYANCLQPLVFQHIHFCLLSLLDYR